MAIYATQKAFQLGAKVVTVSDSNGWVYDPEGIDVEALKEIKEVKRARLTEYKNYRPNSEYHEGRGVWSVKVEDVYKRQEQGPAVRRKGHTDRSGQRDHPASG